MPPLRPDNTAVPCGPGVDVGQDTASADEVTGKRTPRDGYEVSRALHGVVEIRL